MSVAAQHLLGQGHFLILAEATVIQKYDFSAEIVSVLRTRVMRDVLGPGSS